MVLPDLAKDPWDPQTPTGNHPTRAGHLSRQAGHAVTGSTHPRCKPQPSTEAWESPRGASEPSRPKESQSPERDDWIRYLYWQSQGPSTPIIPAETSPAPRSARGHTRNVEAVQAHTTSRRQSQPTPIIIGIDVTPVNLRDPVNTK